MTKKSLQHMDPASVQLLHSEMSNLGAIRQDRVEALQQVIRLGQYHPTGAEIAGAMLSERIF